jgi:hypothetical protein
MRIIGLAGKNGLDSAMRKGWLFILGALLSCAGSALGQTQSAPPVASGSGGWANWLGPPSPSNGGANASLGPPSPSNGGANNNGSVDFFQRTSPGQCLWANTDALLWWVKAAPVSVPTLTTFAPGSPSATSGFGGALGVPGTIVLSPDHLGYNPFGGGRVNIGGWLDSEQRLGLEVSGFLLETQTANSSTFANSAGSPPLRIPFVNVPPGAGFPLGESSFILASPGGATGGQLLSSSLHLWGAEANALFRAVNGAGLSLSALGGFRYLDLHENLSIVSDETILGGGTFSATDIFSTRNQFYGEQLGVKAEAERGMFYGALLAKVALGDDHESVTANGFSTVTGVPGTTPGGFFTQAANIGTHTRDSFCVVPEVQFQVGINIARRIRVFAGYDFLYLSNVVRPGDQIDRTLNLTGNSTLSPGSTGLIGAPRPEPQFNASGFWAQGINVGLQFKF